MGSQGRQILADVCVHAWILLCVSETAGSHPGSHRRHHPLTCSLHWPLVFWEYLELQHATESPARDAIILPARLVKRVEADKDTTHGDAICYRLTNETEETCSQAFIWNGSQRILSGPDTLMPKP